HRPAYARDGGHRLPAARFAAAAGNCGKAGRTWSRPCQRELSHYAKIEALSGPLSDAHPGPVTESPTHWQLRACSPHLTTKAETFPSRQSGPAFCSSNCFVRGDYE